METVNTIKYNIAKDGFAVLADIFTDEEVVKLLSMISQVDISKPTFRKSKDLFAIRQFLQEVPSCVELIFNDKLNWLISNTFGNDYFVVKSIYFDKPEESNWFVSYHQDLTISVNKKMELKGYTSWTIKNELFAVQPPLEILEDNFTIRIHLDHTNDQNGALKVIPKSHLKSIYRPETIDWSTEEELICEVLKGGIMFMKPLLLHSSSRTTNKMKRRVIHIEFSKTQLPGDMMWIERIALKPAANNALAIAGLDNKQ